MNILEANDLVLGYSNHARNVRHAVCEVSLQINDGEIVGLTGVSGSGKTTILRAIAGEIIPFEGEFRWPSGVRYALAYCPQDGVLLDYRTVWENAVLLLESPRNKLDDLSNGLSFVAGALQNVRLADVHSRFPSELSGGMRQRLQVIQALAMNSRIVLLDEPFSQQDRDLQCTLEDLTWKALREHGRAAVIVSHDVDALTAICDRVLFLGGNPARISSVINTPSPLLGMGGSTRRTRPGFSEYSAMLWQERARMASVV